MNTDKAQCSRKKEAECSTFTRGSCMLQHTVAPHEEQLKNKKTLALRQKNKHVVHYENPEK